MRLFGRKAAADDDFDLYDTDGWAFDVADDVTDPPQERSPAVAGATGEVTTAGQGGVDHPDANATDPGEASAASGPDRAADAPQPGVHTDFADPGSLDPYEADVMPENRSQRRVVVAVAVAAIVFAGIAYVATRSRSGTRSGTTAPSASPVIGPVTTTAAAPAEPATTTAITIPTTVAPPVAAGKAVVAAAPAAPSSSAVATTPAAGTTAVASTAAATATTAPAVAVTTLQTVPATRDIIVIINGHTYASAADGAIALPPPDRHGDVQIVGLNTVPALEQAKFSSWGDGDKRVTRPLESVNGPVAQIGFDISDRVQVTARGIPAGQGVVRFSSQTDPLDLTFGEPQWVLVRRAVPAGLGLMSEAITYTAVSLTRDTVVTQLPPQTFTPTPEAIWQIGIEGS